MILAGICGGCFALAATGCIGNCCDCLSDCWTGCGKECSHLCQNCGNCFGNCFDSLCAPFKIVFKTSSEFYADEFAAAQREHEEKCAALQKQVDDEKKSQSTDGLRITVADSSGEICK